jgi:citrate lyase subunit beta/citryl-CoA lyase
MGTQVSGQGVALRLRRSVLFTPASNARAVEKARSLDCDAVVLDLEDSVAPEAKPAAREAAIAALAEGFGGREVIVRCNGIDTPWGLVDLQALAEAGPDAVLAPKVRSAADIEALDGALVAAPASTRLWAMIETPQAVLNLKEIASASGRTRLALLTLGPNDLAAELRLKPAYLRPVMRPILVELALTARAFGLAVLGGAATDLDDLEAFEADCVEEAGLGYDGKTLVHPSQIGPANRAFSPSPDEIAWARKVVAAFAAPEAAGKGALRLEGRMVEHLHLRDAERVLALAVAMPAGAP